MPTVRPGRHDRPHRKQDTGHERLPVQRIVADRQGLAGGAEEHFLVSDEPDQPYGVYRNARDVAPRAPSREVVVASGPVTATRFGTRLGDELGRPPGSAAGRIDLARVVHSMISTESNQRAAYAANLIISTAAMPKFGAISTPADGNS